MPKLESCKQTTNKGASKMKIKMIDVKDLKVGDKVVIDINHQVDPEWVLEVERIQNENDDMTIREYEILVDFKRNDDMPNWVMKGRQFFHGWVLVVW
jgi:hypothetical protein